MRIQESAVQLSASHEATVSRTLEIDTSMSFRTVFEQVAANEGDSVAREKQRVQELLQSLVDAIMAAMDGKSGACREKIAGSDAATNTANPPVAHTTFAWKQSTRETVCESESTTVCGSGVVKTADGRSIDFDFSWATARDYSASHTRIDAGGTVLQDPLVLNFSGHSAELTGKRMDFDLDADGQAESIPTLGEGSGFLVFDRNGNGKADDGSELFGTASGNGFADLASLDSDHNGWIDEGDADWSKFGLWSTDGFRSLGQCGVGALCTASVDAPFSLKDSDNRMLGQIRAAGLYLTEAGQVGCMQQVDLAVSAPDGAQQPEERQHLPT
jgi:hypothetical protein